MKITNLFVNYLFTHIYFYMFIFILQSFILISEMCNLFSINSNLSVIAVILQLCIFMHGFLGLVVVFEDYLFNPYIKMIFVTILRGIGVKLLCILAYSIG